MFLIYCEKDKSYAKVEDCKVVFDADVGVDPGDKVAFYYGSKKYTGEVIIRSDNMDIIDKELKLKRKQDSSRDKSKQIEEKKTKRAHSSGPKPGQTKRLATEIAHSHTSASNSKVLIAKRETTIKNKKVKEALGHQVKSLFDDDNNLSSDIESDSSSDSIVTSPKKKESKANRKKTVTSLKDLQSNSTLQQADKPKESPSKEELKKMLEESQREKMRLGKAIKNLCSEKEHSSDAAGDDSKIIESHEPTDAAEKSDESDSTDDQPVLRGAPKRSAAKVCSSESDNDSDDQLFGKNCKDDDMVLLKDGIYCKAKFLANATGASHKSTHVARKLMKGVFKPTALIKCTLSGQAPRAAGKDNYKSGQPAILDCHARDVIIDYAQNWAKSNNWEATPDKDVKRALVQYMGEIKRDFNKKQTTQAAIQPGTKEAETREGEP